MMNRKIFGRKIFAILLAVSLAFFQTPAAHPQHDPTAPSDTNQNLPTTTPGQGSSDPDLPNPNAENPPISAGGGASTHTLPLPSYVLPADGDRDGDVDQDDYNFLRANFGTQNPAADYNGDGHVDAADYVVWRKHNGRSLALELALIPNPLPGDGDRDGDVDQDDYNFLRANFGTTNPAADYNGDGHVDAADYVVWRKYNGRTIVPLPGDGDRDGDVDQDDYNFLRANFGTTNPAADYNGDGRVDAADYVVWRKYQGKTRLEEYRKVVQANADTLIDEIPRFYGPYGWSADPPDIPSKIATFDFYMETFHNLLTGKFGLISILRGWTENPNYESHVPEPTRNQIRQYLIDMMGYNPDTDQNEGDGKGYIMCSPLIVDCPYNELEFYREWNSYDAFLNSFSDYLTIIDNAQRISILQVAPPVYESPDTGIEPVNDSPANPTNMAYDHYDTVINLLDAICTPTCPPDSGGGSSELLAEAPAAESEVSYPMPSYAPTLAAAISNPSDEDAPIIGTKPRKREREKFDSDEAKTNQIEFVKRLISQLVTHIEYPKASQLPQAMAVNSDSTLQTLAFMADYWEKIFANQPLFPDFDAQARDVQDQTEEQEPEARSNAKTKPKNESKANNLTVIQQYLAQGKGALTKAQDEAVMPAASQ